MPWPTIGFMHMKFNLLKNLNAVKVRKSCLYLWLNLINQRRPFSVQGYGRNETVVERLSTGTILVYLWHLSNQSKHSNNDRGHINHSLSVPSVFGNVWSTDASVSLFGGKWRWSVNSARFFFFNEFHFRALSKSSKRSISFTWSKRGMQITVEWILLVAKTIRRLWRLLPPMRTWKEDCFQRGLVYFRVELKNCFNSKVCLVE
jgi:hypothetical protein